MRLIKWFCRPTRLVGLALLLVILGLAVGVRLRWKAAQSVDHFAQECQAQEQGDTDRAIAELSEAVRLDPNKVEAQRELARLLIRRERWEEAVVALNAALQRLADDAELYVLRAQAHAEMGWYDDRPADLDKALADAGEALRLDRDQARAYCHRALAYSAKFDDDNALAHADEAVRRKPNDAYVFLTRGRVYSNRGEEEKAVADLSQAIHLDPNDARAHTLRGVCRFQLHDDAAALTDCNRAVELAPLDGFVYRYRAKVYREDRRYAKELADLDRAVELNLHDSSSYLQRAICNAKRHDLRRAFADCNSALAINPDSSLALAVRSTCHLARGRRKRAVADMEHAMRRQPKDPFLSLLSAAFYQNINEPDKALTECDRALKKGNDRIARLAYPLRAVCFLQKADCKSAKADCDRALKLDPKSVEAYAIRSVAYAKAGDAKRSAKKDEVDLLLDAFAEAGNAKYSRSNFETALKLDREKAYQFRAEILHVLKLDSEAIADWTELIKITPTEAEPYQARAAAYLMPHLKNSNRRERQSRAEQAIADCKQAIKLAPDDPQSHCLLAAALDVLDRHDEAIHSATEALRLDPEEPEAYLLRAASYLVRKEYNKAIADANEALRLEVEGGRPYALRGLAYAEQGRDAQAKADLAEAARLDPKLAELKEAYDRRLAQQKPVMPHQLPTFDFPIHPVKGPEFTSLFEKPAGEPMRVPSGGIVHVLLGIGAVIFVIALLAGYRNAKAQ